MSERNSSINFGWRTTNRSWMSNDENRNSAAKLILNEILQCSFEGKTDDYNPKDFNFLFNFIHCFLNNYVHLSVDELWQRCSRYKDNRIAKALPELGVQQSSPQKELQLAVPGSSQVLNFENRNNTEGRKRRKTERSRNWHSLRKKFARAKKKEQNAHLKLTPGKLECINYNTVTVFVNMVLRKLLPPDLFGTCRNARHFFMFVRKYLNCVKPPALLEVHKITRCMRIKVIPWLNCLPEKYSQRKQTLLGTVLLWLMENIVETLLSHYFHITKLNKHNNEIFYYSKRMYFDSIKTMVQVMLHGGIIRRLEEDEVKSFSSLSHYLGSSVLRCIPAKTSIRPILIGCKGGPYKKEIEQLLYQLQTINKYRIGPKDEAKMHTLWLHFWKWWKDAGQPKLYFCKADIANAFGSVQLNRLCEVLDDMKSRFLGANMVLKTYKCIPKKCTKWLPYKMSYDGLPNDKLSKYSQVQILNEKNVDVYMLVEWIKMAVKLQVFRFKSKHFLILRGVAQGHWLSSKLCDLYLSHMDEVYLHQFCSDETFMLRAADDYLFISANRDQVKRFLLKMTEGLGTYGCLLSASKCVTNINCEKDSILFCGNLINISTLSISGDYCRYRNYKMIYSLKFAKGKPGKVLQAKMTNFISLKLSGLHLDGTYNERKIVLSGIFQAALLHAFKMHAVIYLHFERKHLHIPFITKLIRTTVLKLASHIEYLLGKCKSSNVEKLEVIWLVYSAIQFVIHKYSGTYKKLHHVIRRQKANFEVMLPLPAYSELSFIISNIPSIFKTTR